MTIRLKRKIDKVILSIQALLVIFAIALYLTACKAKPEKKEEPIGSTNTDLTREELIKRGDYLVNIMGCQDCHSPKIMGPAGPAIDPERMLSGYPSANPILKTNIEAMKSWVLFSFDQTSAVGPWGQTFAANLTSDETGIGNWTEEQFTKALREGKYKGLDGSRPLLPPMPSANYKSLNDEDVKAIFAYLKSTKPVKNIVPAPIPPNELKF